MSIRKFKESIQDITDEFIYYWKSSSTEDKLQPLYFIAVIFGILGSGRFLGAVLGFHHMSNTECIVWIILLFFMNLVVNSDSFNKPKRE